jgi:hypothetical protein
MGKVRIFSVIFMWNEYPRDKPKEFFMSAVLKTFITVISASTGRNDFIFDIWLWHGDLYRVSPFQVYHTSTSCLPCDLQMTFLPVEAEITVMKVFNTADMKNSKSHCKQEVDVR